MASKESSAVKEARKALITHKKSLLRQQRNLRSGMTGLKSSMGRQHMVDAVNEDSVNGSILIGIDNQLKDIELKLERLNDANYGICIDCHQKISAARMKAMPAADRCITCKELTERR